MDAMYPPTAPDFDEIDMLDNELADAIERDLPLVLSATRALLEDDDYAAGLVGATVSLVQSTNESRPAFVKRIVRAWLEEMANA